MKKITVAQYLFAWLEEIRQNRKRTTYDRYSLLVSRQINPYLGSMKLCQISSLHIERLFTDLRQAAESQWTLYHVGVVFQSALRCAEKKDLISRNPFSKVTRVKIPKTQPRFWNTAQAKTFLEQSGADWSAALYVLALTTGMREGELFGLHWPDIDFDGCFLSVKRTLQEVRGRFFLDEPKTASSRRRIDLPEIAIQALNDHRRAMLAEGRDVKEGIVFCDNDGSFLRRSNVARRSFYKLIAQAGVPRIRFHDLRHSAASILLANGENPKVVQERLGHAKIGNHFEHLRTRQPDNATRGGKKT